MFFYFILNLNCIIEYVYKNRIPFLTVAGGGKIVSVKIMIKTLGVFCKLHKLGNILLESQMLEKINSLHEKFTNFKQFRCTLLPILQGCSGGHK